MPDTPAGRGLSAWLDAFNSGDAGKFERFIEQYYPAETAGGMQGFHDQTGGFDLLSIDSSDPLLVKFHLRERNSSEIAIGSLSIRDAATGKIENIGVRAVPAGAKEEDIALDSRERRRVINGVVRELSANYIFANAAKKMGQAILTREKEGAYDQISDGNAFASAVTEDLEAISHDRHLRLEYSPFKIPDQFEGGASAQNPARFVHDIERENCGWEKIEIRPGNVGYAKFNLFAPPDICGPTVVAAMNFLAHVDALIIDLRDNGGGDPKMVDMVVSYLVGGSAHINDVYFRNSNNTHQYWTLPYVPGPKLTRQPVYVLTSKRTFSAGEEFCYDLRTLERATLIGETTGGGAHPVSGHPIDDHFMLEVPEGRSINPVTHEDWEGTGVAPEVAVNPDEALPTAEKLANERVREIRKMQPGPGGSPQ